MRRFLDNGFFLFFGIACLFAGIFDLLHALTYQGMSIFPGVGEDESLQLKTAGRMIASVSFLISPLFLRRKLNAAVTLAVYSGIFVAVLYGVFWGRFPDCYVPGWGMTHFEHFGRAINCVAFIAAAGLLVHKRRELDRRVFHLLLASLAALAASEFASAIAVDFNGSIKVAAHLLEVVSLYLIYAAFVEFGLKKPYDLVFRNLKASAERLRLHSQQSSLAAIEWDTDFRVVAWNPAAEKIFGYTAEEAAGQHWTFLVPSHARPKVDDAWARLSKGQVDAQSINENLTKDGRSILCDWHNTPLTNAEGEFICVVSLAEDVTERKRGRGADAGNAADGSIVGDQSHDRPAHGGGDRRRHRGSDPLDGKHDRLSGPDERRRIGVDHAILVQVGHGPMRRDRQAHSLPRGKNRSLGRGRSAASPGHHQQLCRAQSAQARHAPRTRARRPAHEHPRVRRPTDRGRGGRRQQRRRL